MPSDYWVMMMVYRETTSALTFHKKYAGCVLQVWVVDDIYGAHRVFGKVV